MTTIKMLRIVLNLIRKLIRPVGKTYNEVDNNQYANSSEFNAQPVYKTSYNQDDRIAEYR